MRMPAGAFRSHKITERLDDLFRNLIGHQPEADLRRGGGGDHGFRSDARESAGDAVNLERRPRPDAFQHRISRLARQRRSADFVAQEIRLAKRKLLPAFFFGRCGTARHRHRCPGCGSSHWRPCIWRAVRSVRKPDSAKRRHTVRNADRAPGRSPSLPCKPGRAARCTASADPLRRAACRKPARHRPSAWIGFSATYLAIEAPPTSSSPSIRNFRFTGSVPLTARSASDGLDVHVHLAFVVG